MLLLAIFTALTFMSFCADSLVVGNPRSHAQRADSLESRARITSSCTRPFLEALYDGLAAALWVSNVAMEFTLLRDPWLDGRMRFHFGSDRRESYETAHFHFLGLYTEIVFAAEGRIPPASWIKVPIWCRDLQHRCSRRTAAYVIDGAVNPSRTGFVIVRLSYLFPESDPSPPQHLGSFSMLLKKPQGTKHRRD